jgi:hypothetical protein
MNNATYTYVISTMKSWAETMDELAEQMRLWGVSDWEANYPSGARMKSNDQTEAQRTVQLTYTKNGKSVTLTMGKQRRAVDNLRVLYLAIEAMRLNERRGISDVIESAYLQLAAPAEELDSYELLEIRPGASLEVAEAAYKAKVRDAHPDRGGSVDRMKQLNKAIEDIRKNMK